MVSLHDKYAAHGLSVLAFPCNQFGGQEPGSAAEIKAFVEAHGVAHSDTFRLMAKVDVNGPQACQAYRFLKAASRTGDLGWNFDRYFLVLRSGAVKAFSGRPMEIEDQINRALAGLEDEL